MELMNDYPQGEILPIEVIEALRRELGKVAIDDDNPCIVRGEE